MLVYQRVEITRGYFCHQPHSEKGPMIPALVLAIIPRDSCGSATGAAARCAAVNATRPGKHSRLAMENGHGNSGFSQL